MNTLDTSSVLGLISLGALTTNIVVGVVIWSRKRIKLPLGISLLKAHKFTGYAAALFILVHVGLIPLDPNSGFKWKDLLLPLWTKHQPYINSLGAFAFYVLSTVVISSYFQKKMNYKLWRKLHYLSYGAAAALFVHGIWSDPELKDRAPDFLDGEKVFVEVCAFLFFVLAVYRVRANQTRSRSSQGISKNLGLILLISGTFTFNSFSAESVNSKCCRLDPDLGFVLGGVTLESSIDVFGN